MPLPKIERKIDVEEALKLRIKHRLSFEEIGKRFDCSAQAVQQRLSKFLAILKDPDVLRAYEENKSAILSSIEMEMLQKMLDPETLQKASLNNTAYTFQQVFNANRLTKGQATEIHDQFTFQASLEEIRKRKEELLKEIHVEEIKTHEKT
ncbi:MAG: hypothetical protein E3K36_10660 [Candidatus Brocadia sp.]|nr:hypothetical protein [Candidatus Brocadia sp.]